jgi:hypothetical protein
MSHEKALEIELTMTFNIRTNLYITPKYNIICVYIYDQIIYRAGHSKAPAFTTQLNIGIPPAG